MPYAIINKSGCGIYKNRAKLRLDLFLNPDEPNYDRYHISVPIIPEGGYSGEMDKRGTPQDQTNYDAWLDSLPHIWQDNPFHSHFVYPDKDVSDTSIKAEIRNILNYFYTFHQHCWNKGIPFIDEWKKVPRKKGTVRCRFVRGNPRDLSIHQIKVQGIINRAKEFEVNVSKVSSQDLNIGKKGTIIVGPSGQQGTSYLYYTNGTDVDTQFPASGTGTLDTVEIYSSLLGMSNIEVATFIPLGSNKLSTRDNVSVGNAVSGLNTFTGLSIDVVSGDYIGLYFTAGALLVTFSGGDLHKIRGDYIPCTNQTFTPFIYGLSIHGTGTETAANSLLKSDTNTILMAGTNSLFIR